MQGSFLRRIDKPLVILYVVFLILGWVCIYEASYVKTQTSIFDIHYRSGMQLLWIGVSVITALVILNTKPLVFYSWSYITYIGVIILLVVTLFVAPNIKGSHSWLVIGSFSLQPAEFAKFSTALVLAYFYSLQSFSNISLSRKIFITVFVIALPMIIILLQKETGSALVFLAFLIMLYREGLSSFVILITFLAITLFIVTIRFSGNTEIFYTEHFGNLVSINIILIVSAFIYDRYCQYNLKLKTLHILGIIAGAYVVSLLLNKFVIRFDIRSTWVVGFVYHFPADYVYRCSQKSILVACGLCSNVHRLFVLCRYNIRKSARASSEDTYRDSARAQRRPAGSRMEHQPVENSHIVGTYVW